MTKTYKPMMVALPPGTNVLTLEEEVTPEGEIHYSAEPAFALIYDHGRAHVLGLLDNEVSLGVHGPRHSQVAYTLVPMGITPQDLEGFVAVTHARLFGSQPQYTPAPPAPPAPPENGSEGHTGPVLGVVSPPAPSPEPAPHPPEQPEQPEQATY